MSSLVGEPWGVKYRMTPTHIIIALSIMLLVLVAIIAAISVGKRRADARISTFNAEMLAASQDASVGRRLTVPRDG